MISKALQHLKIERDDRNVVTVWIDVAKRSMNVFDDAVIGELEFAVSQVESRPAAVVVFRSAKASGFFAGADVQQIARLQSREEVEAVILRGQKLFARIEDLSIPTLAVIHGPCLGGGLEFALACSHRLACDSSATTLGLPEVQLGLIPGWGGTQRLPKLIGLTESLPMILQARKKSATAALKLGLVDMIAKPEQWDDAVQKVVNSLLSRMESAHELAGLEAKPPQKSTLRVIKESWPVRWFIFQIAQKQIAKDSRNYPALPAALRAVRAALHRGVNGFAVERMEFAQLIETSTCRNLLKLFCRRERARSLSHDFPVTRRGGVADGPRTADFVEDSVPKIQKVGVIGAGAMGAGIGQLAALRGFDVVLKELTPELAAAGQERVTQLLNDMVSKKKLSTVERDEVLSRISVVDSFAPLADCDLVIEAVVEKMEIKRAVFAELDAVLKPSAILVSNTSALSVGQMASATGRPDRVAGLHFFNPVHRMDLVEVVRWSDDASADSSVSRSAGDVVHRPTKRFSDSDCSVSASASQFAATGVSGNATSDQTVMALLSFVKKLGKTPVVTDDSPGFLVNRVLFPYIGEAVRMVLEGHSPNALDREVRRFGMPMGPVELIDHVGIDVAWHVAETLRGVLPESDDVIHLLGQMVAHGWLGRKSGSGFYVYDQGKRMVNPDLLQKCRSLTDGSASQRKPGDSDFQHPTAGEFVSDGMTDVQRRLIYPMINEVGYCMQDGVVAEAWMADLAMILGTGFAPFRGGPMTLAEHIGHSTLMNNLHVLTVRHGERFKPSAWLVERRADSSEDVCVTA